MIGMLVLVFFPFFYGLALSFTNANLYNTRQADLRDLGRPAELRRHPERLHVAKRTAEGARLELHNFYYTLLFTIVWTVSNVPSASAWG